MGDQRPVAIVVPVEEEFAAYRGLVEGVRRVGGCGPWEVYEGFAAARLVVLVISDCGPANAAAATERVIAKFEPVAVLHGGSAGAHNAALLPGDLVAGSHTCILTSVAEQQSRRSRGLHRKRLRFRRDGARVHLDRAEADPELLRRAARVAREIVGGLDPWAGPGWPADTPRRPGRAVVGLIGSSDTWTADSVEIRALREAYGAECEDMESAFVAQVCAMHRMPFVAVRCISNNEVACPLAPGDVAAAVAAAGERTARVLARVAAEL